MLHPSWATLIARASVNADADEYTGLPIQYAEPEPAPPPGPEIPAEVHNTRVIDGKVCMDATRALCAGVR
jgi:hypothetical protein